MNNKNKYRLVATEVGKQPLENSRKGVFALWITDLPVNLLLLVGLLASVAITISLLPTMGVGGQLHWILYEVATNQISPLQAYQYILGDIGFLGMIPQVQESVWWIVTTVSTDGIWAIGGAIADLIASGGIVGVAIAVIGAATLG